MGRMAVRWTTDGLHGPWTGRTGQPPPTSRCGRCSSAPAGHASGSPEARWGDVRGWTVAFPPRRRMRRQLRIPSPPLASADRVTLGPASAEGVAAPDFSWHLLDTHRPCEEPVLWAETCTKLLSPTVSGPSVSQMEWERDPQNRETQDAERGRWECGAPAAEEGLA